MEQKRMHPGACSSQAAKQQDPERQLRETWPKEFDFEIPVLVQGKASDLTKADANIRLPIGEGFRLPVQQSKNTAAVSSVRVWMGQGNGWSHPVLLSTEGRLVSNLSFFLSEIIHACIATV